MKNTLGGIKSRSDSAEEKFSELVAIATETIQNRTHRKRKTGKKEQNFSQLWDKIKWPNRLVIGIPERKEGKKNIWKSNTLKFFNLRKIAGSDIHEAQPTSNKRKPYQITT